MFSGTYCIWMPSSKIAFFTHISNDLDQCVKNLITVCLFSYH